MQRLVLVPILFCLAVAAQSPPASTSLPDPRALLERAIANQRKLADVRERYSCRVENQSTELDSHGKVKKTENTVSERFFVNGIPIEHTLSKDGKDLSPEELKKEDDRVMKETLKYSNQSNATREIGRSDQGVEDFLSAMILTNGRRQIENGRGVLYYDIVPNPGFQARNLAQRFATVIQGTGSIDEQTGNLIDVNLKSVADLKIGGGLLADLHKGFWIHIHDHAEADGVWLTDLAEGSGDVRAALFFHPYFRFKQSTGGCHLYNATATQVGPAKPVK
jgi:hypothetical protein